MTIIRDALEQYALNNTKSWESDRSQTIGASEIGKCSRQVFWNKYEGDSTYGVARDPDYVDTWGAKARGTYYEDHFWVPAMRARFGRHLLYTGDEQVTLVSGFLSATPDGLVIGPWELDPKAEAEFECYTIECKTIDPRVTLTKPKDEHEFQAQVQMGLIRLQTPYRPTHAIISYTDASFWDKVTEFKIDYDHEAFEVARHRAQDIMNAKSGSELRPEGWIAGGKECEVCPFTKACGVERSSLPTKFSTKPMAPELEEEITELALAIGRFEEVVDTNQNAIRSMKDALKNKLRDAGHRWLDNDKVKISWSSVKGRETYDNKAIQELATFAGLDIETCKKVGEPSDRMQITVKALPV